MPDQVHHFTLLDGEMVIDNPMNEKGQARRRYLVYDLVAINGESVVEVGTVIISSHPSLVALHYQPLSGF